MPARPTTPRRSKPLFEEHPSAAAVTRGGVFVSGDAKLNLAPLIVTLRFDASSFAHFQAMRIRHFPPERNHIPAHLTLFHHLPGEDERAVRDMLAAQTKARAPMPLAVTGLRFLGYGCAYRIESPALKALRADLAASFTSPITPQDAAPFHPHVTIQNKASAPQAKALFAELSAAFTPFEAQATGLFIHRYRGGPWDKAGEFGFGQTAAG